MTYTTRILSYCLDAFMIYALYSLAFVGGDAGAAWYGWVIGLYGLRAGLGLIPYGYNSRQIDAIIQFFEKTGPDLWYRQIIFTLEMVVLLYAGLWALCILYAIGSAKLLEFRWKAYHNLRAVK